MGLRRSPEQQRGQQRDVGQYVLRIYREAPAGDRLLADRGRQVVAHERAHLGIVLDPGRFDAGAHVDGAEELARQILENPQTAVRSLVQVRRAMIVADSARYKAVAPAFDWATSSEAKAAVAARAAGIKD